MKRSDLCTLAIEFKNVLSKARKVTVLTGAGASAESGIPTFRGPGGFWRSWSATELATPQAFYSDPSLVWEFYHYRRCIVSNAMPNNSHFSLSEFETNCEKEGKEYTLITQNIDGLHQKAGSKNVLEMHGSLWYTRCTNCAKISVNKKMPIWEALGGRGLPDPSLKVDAIPSSSLPRCIDCNGLLRPNVVWFGENLDTRILNKVYNALDGCDLFLVIGTSAVVHPAASFASEVKRNGGLIAEFNIEPTSITPISRFFFQGTSAQTLSIALGLENLQ